MSDTIDQVEEIFHRALSISSEEERGKFIDKACAASPRLLRDVKALLRTHESTGPFLEYPPELGNRPTDGPDSRSSSGSAPTLPPKPSGLVRSSDDSLPRRFGDYELLEEIARGGMGVVYKAQQVSLNRTVALKMIRAGKFASDEEVKRFYIEAEAAAQLDHRGIVPVFDVGSCEGQHFFSMGLVEGDNLADVLKSKPLSPRTAAAIVKRISEAAQVAHDQGIVHRDLKPSNVLLDKNGEPRVTDFGLAKINEADSQLTTTGMIIGTPSYMPPEQASGSLNKINASVDIYSLGAILYAALTGRPPFDGTSQLETLTHVLHEEPAAPRQVIASIPKDLEAICLKCLEKNAADRYASASEVAKDLGRFLAGEPIGAKNDLFRRFRRWTINEPVLASQLAAIAFMMLVIFINYAIFGYGKQRSFEVLLINQGILLGWALAAFVLQKVRNVVKTVQKVAWTWAAINPVFLTSIIAANDAPRGSLLSLYLLLMVTTCFFRRVELVAITMVSSLAGYLVLVLFFLNREEQVIPESYQVIFAATLVIGGVLMGFLTLRLKRLSQEDAR